MITELLPSSINLESFYSFVKLTKAQQREILKEEGVFLDLDNDKETLTRLYFLHGFFVEEIICKNLNTVEFIPYKQGYKLANYLRIAGNFSDHSVMIFDVCLN